MKAASSKADAKEMAIQGRMHESLDEKGDMGEDHSIRDRRYKVKNII